MNWGVSTTGKHREAWREVLVWAAMSPICLAFAWHLADLRNIEPVATSLFWVLVAVTSGLTLVAGIAVLSLVDAHPAGYPADLDLLSTTKPSRMPWMGSTLGAPPPRRQELLGRIDQLNQEIKTYSGQLLDLAGQGEVAGENVALLHSRRDAALTEAVGLMRKALVDTVLQPPASWYFIAGCQRVDHPTPPSQGPTGG